MATQDNKQVLVSLEEMKQAFTRMQQEAERSGIAIDGVADKGRNLAAAMAGFAGISFGGAAFIKQLVDVRTEFQNTEAQFKVFLGSAEKAADFMSNLQDAAYWNVFEFKDLAEQSAQLLAYKTNVDDVIPTIQRLSEIAAGTGKPLEELVAVFNKVKSTDVIDAQTLQRIKGMGIDIQQILAEMQGKTASMISASSLRFKDLETAVKQVTDEGGMYAGMMEEKMKTLGDSVGLLQDNVTSMFNEIGEKSQDVLKGGISALNFLVENYEVFGKTLLTLISIYGAYKTAVTVCSVVTKVATEMNKGYTLTQMIQYKWELMLEKAIMKKNAAMLAANPALALAVIAIMALVAAMVIWKDRSTEEEKALKRVNEQLDKKLKKHNELMEQSKSYIQTLEDETAATDKLAEAYAGLLELPAFEGLTEEDLRNMGTEEIAQRLQNYDNQIKKQATQEALNENISSYAHRKADVSSEATQKAMRGIGGGYVMQAANEQAKIAEERYNDVVQLAKQAAEEQIAELGKVDKEQRKVKYTELIDGLTTANAQMEEENQTLDANSEQFYLNEARIAANNIMLAKYQANLGSLQDTEVKYVSVSEQLRVAREDLARAEKRIADIRAGLIQVEDPNKEIEAQQALVQSSLTTIKNLTGQTYVDQKTLRENLRKLNEKAQKEEIALEERKVQDKRRLLDLQLKDRLAELDREEREYNKANNGGSAKSRAAFNRRRETIKLEVEFDRAQADKEFDDWKRNFERETVQIRLDMETSAIENQIDLAVNITDKIRLQNELYEKQIELKKRSSQIDLEDTIYQKYGIGNIEKNLEQYRAFSGNENNKAVLSSYANATTREDKEKVAKSAGLSVDQLDIYSAIEANYGEIEKIYAKYQERLAVTLDQASQQHNADMLRQDIDDYSAYCEEIINAAREREEALAAIENGEDTNRTKAMVEADYHAKVKRAGEDHSIDATEQEAASIVARLVNSLADVTYDQVDAAAKTFFDQLDEQMQMLEEVQGMSQEQRDAAAQQAQQDLETLQQQAGDPNATDEQKAEIQGRIAEIEQRLVYLKMTESQMDGQMVKLLHTKRTMEDSVATAKQSSGKKSVKQMQTEQRVTNKVVDALGEVSSAAKAVANTMGGVLSKKSKKALGVISDVADFGIQSIQSIQYVATNASTLMESTAVGAAGAIQTVEKASVILTIISLAVQAIMAIVNIAKQFTQNAKVNEELDEMAANIERLKEEQRDLDWQMRNSKGVQYFKDNAAAAKNLTKQIEANRAAYEKSLKEEERLNRKYGEDSDKASDQHERTQEFKEAWEDAISEQEERWQEMVDTILTTDLSGWADTLADSAIEAALDGSKSFQEIWNEALEQWERDMYKQQLKLAYEELFKDSFDRFSAKAKAVAEAGGQLSESDIDEFVAEMENKQDEAERLAEMYRELMERRGLLTDESDVEGSKGGFQSMSQDQADTLTARFTAVQVAASNVAANAENMLGVLEVIADNDRLRLASIQSMASNIDIGVTIQQNILDQTRMIAETVANIKEDTARLRAIEQNTDKL